MSKKIVAVTGHSGCGKSTVAKMLTEKLPNAKLLLLDLPFIAAPLKFAKEFEEIFKMPLDVNDHINCLRLAMDSSSEALRNYMELIRPFLDEEVEKELVNLKADDGVDFIIIEYISLPKLLVWRKADYRIMVDAPREERNTRLYERERDDTISIHSNPKCGEIREEAVKDFMATAHDVSYMIYNCYDDHLEKEVQYLCEKIAASKNLLLPA